jgi:hypothetical protein
MFGENERQGGNETDDVERDDPGRYVARRLTLNGRERCATQHEGAEDEAGEVGSGPCRV